MADNKSKVVHKQVYRKGPFGGTLNTTVCGRLHSGNEHNCSDVDREVTCKVCLKLIELLKLRTL